MDSKDRTFLIVVAVTALPFCALMILLLTSIFGTPIVGIRCTRSDGPARCEVLRARFFGFTGDRPIVIPESEIRGARTLRPLPHPGRGGGGYSAALVLRTGAYREYPVLHSRFRDRADAATRKLNSYFSDRGAISIELHEDSSELLFPLASVGVLVAVLAVLAMRRRAHSR